MYGSWRSSSQTIEIVHGDKASSMDPVTCDPGSRGYRQGYRSPNVCIVCDWLYLYL